MEWGINDQLKSRAYGQKKEGDAVTKQDKIQEYASKGGHYYPTDKEGKFDEWGAMIKHMSARHQVEEKEKQEKMRQQRLEYMQFLDQQRLEKLNKKYEDSSIKKHEYDHMLQKDKVLKQLNDQKSLEDKTFQSYLNSQYVTSVQQHETKKKFDRDTEIQEERRK